MNIIALDLIGILFTYKMEFWITDINGIQIIYLTLAIIKEEKP